MAKSKIKKSELDLIQENNRGQFNTKIAIADAVLAIEEWKDALKVSKDSLKDLRSKMKEIQADLQKEYGDIQIDVSTGEILGQASDNSEGNDNKGNS